MIEQTYLDLMSKLDQAQRQIGAARKAYDDAAKAAKDAERYTDDEKAAIVIQTGGYSVLGKNADEREYKLFDLLRNSASYQSYLANQRKAEVLKVEAKRSFDDAMIAFDVLRIQADLTGNFIKYSALAASKPHDATLLDL